MYRYVIIFIRIKKKSILLWCNRELSLSALLESLLTKSKNCQEKSTPAAAHVYSAFQVSGKNVNKTKTRLRLLL